MTKSQAPKQIAASHCPSCDLVAFASHVNSPDQTPVRFCQHCGLQLDIYIYSNPKKFSIGKGTPRK